MASKRLKGPKDALVASMEVQGKDKEVRGFLCQSLPFALLLEGEDLRICEEVMSLGLTLNRLKAIFRKGMDISQGIRVEFG